MQQISNDCAGKTCAFHAKQFCTLQAPCTQDVRDRLDNDEGRHLSNLAFTIVEDLMESVTDKCVGEPVQLSIKLNGIMVALESVAQGEMTTRDRQLREFHFSRVPLVDLGLTRDELRGKIGLPHYSGQQFNSEEIQWQ